MTQLEVNGALSGLSCTNMFTMQTRIQGGDKFLLSFIAETDIIFDFVFTKHIVCDPQLEVDVMVHYPDCAQTCWYLIQCCAAIG